MLKPLLEDDFPTAAALLAEGFPVRTRAFWEGGLQRLKRHAGNAACGVPLGQLLVSDGQAVGIALTPASPRLRSDGRRYNLINFSSWYIRPEHRWRAPLMLRGLVRDPEATYIDLTPTPQVEKMLVASGFSLVNAGSCIAPLPLQAALPGRGARLRELAATDTLSQTAPPMEMLLAHRELGCVPLVMEHEGGSTLFVYRPRPLRGLPAARLKYIGSHARLVRHLPVLARHLLARGLLWLTWDARDGHAAGLGTLRRDSGKWYAKGEITADCTDFIGSELCILGL
jgi:hypothetical protein